MMIEITREECIAISRGMTSAWRTGYDAGARGWTTVSDLVLAGSERAGAADAYRMGYAAGERDRSCIAVEQSGPLEDVHGAVAGMDPRVQMPAAAVPHWD